MGVALKGAQTIAGSQSEDVRELAAILGDIAATQDSVKVALSKTGIVLEKDFDLSAIDILREAAADIRTNTEGLAEKITALQQRLSDNPAAAEVTAIAAELGTIGSQLSNVGSSIDAIDPDVPGGVEPDPDNPGEVTEPNP